MKRRLVVAVLGFALIVPLGLGGLRAHAAPREVAPPQGIDSAVNQMGGEWIDSQAALSDYVGWLNVRGYDRLGYLAPVFDVKSKSVELMWKDVTSALQDEVVGEATRRGVSVTFRPVNHSASDLQKQQQEVLDLRKDLILAGFTIDGVSGVTPDGVAKLKVHGRVTPASNGRTGYADRASVQQYLERRLGVPLDVVDGVVPLAATRVNDTPSFNAGGLMRGAVFNFCSTGFGIRIGTRSHTTTARHCVHEPWFPASNPLDYQYGITARTTVDGARVLTSGGSNLMFDGAWNDATGFKKTVHGFADVGMGAYVCTSGAMSGVHCWGVVDEMLHQHCDQFGCFSTIGAARYGQGIMAAVGDSGGPVLIPYTNGKVGAVGMIQGGDPRWEETPNCGSMFDSSMRCFRRVFFSSTRTIVNSIPDATLRTG